jgi:hypothetical protein
VATTFPRDLLFAANVVSAGAAAAGSGFTQRQLDDGDLVQDRVVATAGSYGATSPINATCNWSMQLVAFKGQ